MVYNALTTADELALAVGGLSSERYIRIGHTIVRCDDVRAVYATESTSGPRGAGRTGETSMSTMQQDRIHTGGETTSRMGPMRGQRGWADTLGETKGSPKTTELLALLLGVLAIAICTAVFDNLDVWRGLLLITGLTGAYIVSRGIAKAGSAHHEHGSHGHDR